MKRLVLTDALMREALSPGPQATAPAGLLAQITADVARTPQARTLRLPPSRRLAWVAVGAATLLALVGALFVAGGSRNPFEAFLPPAPSPLLQRLPVEMGPWGQIEAVGADEVWVAEGMDNLWHRTAAGWAGPIQVHPTGTGTIRDLARTPDGRVVVSAESGIWVGGESGWTNVSHVSSWGVSSGAAGVIWGATVGGLRAYRQFGDTWDFEAYSCPAGGNLLARAADGSAWTAGIDFSGGSGVAHLTDGSCEESDPWGDGATHDVLGIATDREGRVAVTIMDVQEPDGPYPGGRIMTWDGQRWATLRDGVEVWVAWNALSYGPDGNLWAAFGGELWQYADGVETSVRSGVEGPVSVAPDGTVWFVALDAATGAAFVDRLLPDSAAPEPSAAADATPGPSALLELDASVSPLLLGLDKERAWIAKGDESAAYEIWSRTAGGWHGPMTIHGLGLVRGLADVGDGRIAVASDNGVWVGNASGWTTIWNEQANAVEMDSSGTLWVAGLGNRGTSSLRSFRESGDGWSLAWSGCRAGGWSLDVASDGSAWTSGFDYSGTAGIARAGDRACEAITSVAGLDTTNVEKLAAGPSGRVAAVVQSVQGSSLNYAHLVEWDGERWTQLESGDETVAGHFGGIGYASDGALWAVIEGRLSRFANGAWTPVADATRDSPVSPAQDGAVWYVGRDGSVARTDPLEFGPAFQRDGPNPTDFDGYMAVVAMVAEGEQWLVAPGSGQGLVAWQRTPSGWTGPYVVESQRASTGYPHTLVQLSDGRFAVSAEGGLWVGREAEWTRLRDQDTAGIAMGKDGTLWFGARDTPGLLSMRETPDGWQPGPVSCAAGGGIVAVGPDGAVWSAPVSMQSLPSIVHVVEGRCEELVPVEGARWQVLALGPDLVGGVTAVLDNRTESVERTQVMHWDGRSWTTLRDVVGSTGNAALAYGADGTLWMVWNAALARYADGAWTDVTAAANGFLGMARNGSIWFYDEREGYRTVDSLETASPSPDAIPPHRPAPGGFAC